MNKDAVAEISQKYQVEAAQKLVPEGYKQTEVGVIPEDWSVKKLKDITLDMLQGINTAIDIPKYELSGVPMFKANNVIDQSVQVRDVDFVSEETYVNYSDRYKIKSGDFLFSNIGARLGTGSLFVGNYPCTFAWNIMKITPDINKVIPGFLAFLINSPAQSEKIKSEQSGSGMGFIPKSVMQNILVPVPSNLQEQASITNFLFNVDALLSELEKLIAKKQAIKTATMQQLLTGHTRLPQFANHPDGSKKGYKQSELGEIPEDWEVRAIHELGIVDPENLPSTTNPDYEFKYISLEQVDTGVLLGTATYSFSTAPSRARRVLRRHDVLLSTVRPNLMSHYFVQDEVDDLICSTGFSVIRCFEDKLVASYLYQHLFSTVINAQIDLLITGSNYPAINSSDTKKLKIQISSIDEQTSIASILSDMDAEIQALEHRLNKTRQIKQGMMQELLTGRTRLL